MKQGQSIQMAHVKWKVFSGSSMQGSEDGMALVLVMILSVISLAFMASLIYMTTTMTQMSGGHKRYETALEGGKAGVDVVHQFIDDRGNPNIPGINLVQTAVALCMDSKLTNPTYTYDNMGNATYNWSSCGTAAVATSTLIDSTNSGTYDMNFDIGTNPTYRVYAKIVDTVQGNSGANTGLLKTGVVSTNSGEMTPMNVPFLYTIEVLSENLANPVERARFSVLHEY